jgi:hypothetical protein
MFSLPTGTRKALMNMRTKARSGLPFSESHIRVELAPSVRQPET